MSLAPSVNGRNPNQGAQKRYPVGFVIASWSGRSSKRDDATPLDADFQAR